MNCYSENRSANLQGNGVVVDWVDVDEVRAMSKDMGVTLSPNGGHQEAVEKHAANKDHRALFSPQWIINMVTSCYAETLSIRSQRVESPIFR